MNALLVGFFGEGNLGDEAILQGVLSTLPPGHRISVTAGNHRQHQGPEYLPRQGLVAWHRFIRELQSSRHIWFAGGILQDWSFEGTTFFGLRVLAAHHLGKPPSFWGAGIGPFHRRSTRRFVSRVLRYPHPVWLRDKHSCDLYHALTGRTANLGADWSWAIPPCVSQQEKIAPGTIGMNLRPWFFNDWQHHLQMLSAGLPAGKPQLGIAARPEDRRLMHRLVPHADIKDCDDFASLIGLSAQLCEGWAMRYHVLLAMLRAGIPVIPLPYDEKVRSLCEEAGISLPVDVRQAPFLACHPRPDFSETLLARFQSMKRAFLAQVASDS